ncbi:hypothetical protein [Sorangium sp. So ce385]|uniref:hypothetical protein n=1 Tax=Sorangium sp. So ce385 TaxID=3133308 RepID=UPI003F5B3219
MRVIAAAGLSGAGKTQVLLRAAELLGGAPILHFDEYAAVSTLPMDMRAWLEAGGDIEAYQTPQFARDLRALRAWQSVTLPGGGVVQPGSVVLVEEPMGRARKEMTALIDFVAFLDAPFDVLLARRLLRRMEEEREQLSGRTLDVLRADLRYHLELGRRLHVHGQHVVPQAADIVIDSTRPLDDVARALLHAAGLR